MSGRASRPDARVGAAVTLVGGVALLVLAVLLVPWNPVPGGMPDPIPGGDVFTPEQIAAAEQFSRWARVWGWSALAVSMAVACWLGFTRPAAGWSSGCRAAGGPRWCWAWRHCR